MYTFAMINCRVVNLSRNELWYLPNNCRHNRQTSRKTLLRLETFTAKLVNGMQSCHSIPKYIAPISRIHVKGFISYFDRTLFGR